MDPLEALREWHGAVGLPIASEPTLDLPEPVLELRCSIIEEEASELRHAVEAADVVGVADALADLLYATYAAAITFGIPIDEVFAEVHRSNMTKVGPDGAVERRGDGKVLKGPAYEEPRLAPILERHGLPRTPDRPAP